MNRGSMKSTPRTQSSKWGHQLMISILNSQVEQLIEMWKDTNGEDATPAAMVTALETMKQTKGIIDQIKSCGK